MVAHEARIVQQSAQTSPCKLILAFERTLSHIRGTLLGSSFTYRQIVELPLALIDGWSTGFRWAFPFVGFRVSVDSRADNTPI